MDLVHQAHPERALDEVDDLVRVVVVVEGRALARRGLGGERAQRSSRLLAERLDLDRAADGIPQRSPLTGMDDEALWGLIAHEREPTTTKRASSVVANALCVDDVPMSTERAGSTP